MLKLSIFSYFLPSQKLPSPLKSDKMAVSIVGPSSVKNVLTAVSLEKCRMWHHEFRSLAIKINSIKELLGLDAGFHIETFVMIQQYIV